MGKRFMQIYFDHQIFSLQSWGGISRYFVELGEGLTLRPETNVVIGNYYASKGIQP